MVNDFRGESSLKIVKIHQSTLEPPPPAGLHKCLLNNSTPQITCYLRGRVI